MFMVILVAALCLSGCATGPSPDELKNAAECLEAIGMTDVQVVDDHVLYTVDPVNADLPTTNAAIAACNPGATAESVLKAVTG